MSKTQRVAPLRVLGAFFAIAAIPGIGLVVAGDIKVEGKLTSTTTTGPPLQVSSSDVVTNLNADLLDGSEATDFAAAADTFTKAEMDALLASVEPRTVVNDLPGSSSAVHVIAAPGSYYLVSNVIGESNKAGVEIQASNVTLDLNGFVLSATGITTPRAGITIDENDYKGIEVKNGVITGWSAGIDFDVGGIEEGGIADYVRLERLRVTGNQGAGIKAGIATTLTDSIVADNGDNGVSLGGGSIVSGTATANNLNGIVLSDGSLASECTAVNNTLDGITVLRGVVRGCVARVNGDEGIVATEALVDGNSSNQNTNGEITATNATLADNHTEP